MSILSKVTRKAMWKNRTRTIVTIIGIILSAAMFTAVTTLGYSLWSYMRETEIYETGDYYLRFDYATQSHVDALAEELSDVKVAKVNVDEERELAKKYRIFSIPTVLVIKNGQVTNKSVGVQSREALLAML